MQNRQGQNFEGRVNHSLSLYQKICSLENLFTAWREFRRGKQLRPDVLEFSFALEDNIFDVYEDLNAKTYQHGGYLSFYVNDPKRRFINKASVRDRLVHHALVRVIEPLFDPALIFDSWSCRKGKGVHRAVDRFQKLAWSLSRNNTIPVWVLKLDISKYFASIDQTVLLDILRRRIACPDTIDLAARIIKSYEPGLPLGNITSQLFANIYLNELDQYVKRELRVPNYLRYCDDFVILHHDKSYVEGLIPQLQQFLKDRLLFTIHPDKIIVQRLSQGADFLGFICFPHYRILRTKAKRRMLRKATNHNLTSYLGLIGHTSSRGLHKILLQKIYENENRITEARRS